MHKIIAISILHLHILSKITPYTNQKLTSNAFTQTVILHNTSSGVQTFKDGSLL